MQINVTKSSLPIFEEYCNEIRDIWDTHWLTNMGPKHNALSNRLKDYLTIDNISLFNNGHTSLEIAIDVFKLSGEIITTPFTFISTTHAIVRNGLKPVFCDINLEDFTIDTNKLENLINENTSAILPVHVYGNVCNVEEIEKIAKKYNLKVIYDAAHAFGVKYRGVGISNFGDISMFSFHATKVFNTIEGGALAYKDNSMKATIEAYKNFGLTGQESVEYIGTNSKMNEFQAAMGICNLRLIDNEIAKRKKVFERYVDNLKNIEGIKLNLPANNVETNYAYFPVLFDGYRKTRDEVFNELQQHSIFSRKYFSPLTTEFSCYKGKYEQSYTPVAKYVSERILTLPLYADLLLEDVDKICTIIKQ